MRTKSLNSGNATGGKYMSTKSWFIPALVFVTALMLANVMAMAQQITGVPGSPGATTTISGNTVGVAALTLVILLSGRTLRRVLGDVGLSIVTRILGLLVASIGMQFLVTATSNVIVHTIAPQVLKLQ